MLIAFVGGTEAETTPEERFERLIDLPPSAKLVYKVLDVGGPSTQSRLAEETRLSSRTVRAALSQMESAALVTSEIYVLDARKKVYRPKPVARRE